MNPTEVHLESVMRARRTALVISALVAVIAFSVILIANLAGIGVALAAGAVALAASILTGGLGLAVRLPLSGGPLRSARSRAAGRRASRRSPDRGLAPAG